MTRASTMILALLIVHFVLGSLSLVVGRGMERPLALRLWGAGLLTYAAEAAKRLHQRVKSVATPDSGDHIPVTLSGGVASAPDDGSTWEELFAVADERLYEAKRSGRDKVVCGGAAGRAARSDPSEWVGTLVPAT